MSDRRDGAAHDVLARYFGTSEQFWLNLQVRYDLEVERERLGKRLAEEVSVRRAS